MKPTTENEIGFFETALLLVGIFFALVVIPMLLALKLADILRPLPAVEPGSAAFKTALDEQQALGWKIFLCFMAFLGICVWAFA